MTKHKIDDLFQQKLADSEFTPSPAAWSKLENQLVQKKKKGIIFWMSMAASIALLLTFGWLIYVSGEETIPVKTIAQNNMDNTINSVSADSTKTQNNTPSVNEKAVTEENIKPSEKGLKQKGQTDNKAKQPKNKQKQPIRKSRSPLFIEQKSNLAQNDTPKKVIEEVANSTTMDEAILTKELQQNTNEVLAINRPVEQIEKPIKESGSVKIVYTLKAATSSDSTQQTPAEKIRISPFKKAVALAKNIKENPKGIGSLRDAKNNFLSFSKKKDDSK